MSIHISWEALGWIVIGGGLIALVRFWWSLPPTLECSRPEWLKRWLP